MAASCEQLSEKQLQRLGARQVLSFPMDISINDQDTGDGAVKQRRCSSVLYSGEAVERDFGTMVVNLATIRIPKKQRFPMLFSHGRAGLCADLENPEVGVWDGLKNDGRTLTGEGYLLNDNERADRIANAAKQNYPWEQSIGLNDGNLLLIPVGEKRTINGREFVGDGKLYSLEYATFREASICHVGADAGGSTSFDLGGVGETINLFSDEGLSRNGPTKRRKLFSAFLSRLTPGDRKEIQTIVQELNAPAGDAALSPGDLTMSTPTPAPAPAPAVASLAELKALPGADSDFVLAALEAKLTVGDACQKLLGTMGEKLKTATEALAAKDDELKKLRDEHAKVLADMDQKLAAANRAGGEDGALALAGAATGKASGSVPDGARRIEGLSGKDPKADWKNSEALRAYWNKPGNGGEKAFTSYAANCLKDGDDYTLIWE